MHLFFQRPIIASKLAYNSVLMKDKSSSPQKDLWENPDESKHMETNYIIKGITTSSTHFKCSYTEIYTVIETIFSFLQLKYPLPQIKK